MVDEVHVVGSGADGLSDGVGCQVFGSGWLGKGLAWIPEFPGKGAAWRGELVGRDEPGHGRSGEVDPSPKEADQERGFSVIVVAQVEQCRGARRAEIPSPLPRHSAIQPAVGVVEVSGDDVMACQGENTGVGAVWGAGAF